MVLTYKEKLWEKVWDLRRSCESVGEGGGHQVRKGARRGAGRDEVLQNRRGGVNMAWGGVRDKIERGERWGDEAKGQKRG